MVSAFKQNLLLQIRRLREILSIKNDPYTTYETSFFTLYLSVELLRALIFLSVVVHVTQCHSEVILCSLSVPKDKKLCAFVNSKIYFFAFRLSDIKISNVQNTGWYDKKEFFLAISLNYLLLIVCGLF